MKKNPVYRVTRRRYSHRVIQKLFIKLRQGCGNVNLAISGFKGIFVQQNVFRANWPQWEKHWWSKILGKILVIF
jgi:hypothetical protein